MSGDISLVIDDVGAVVARRLNVNRTTARILGPQSEENCYQD
jgi:hypothetical protein